MIRFLKNSIWDMLLCSVMVFACATTIFSGFYVPSSQITQYWVTGGVTVGLVLLLTLASYNKRSIVIGIIAFVAGFTALIVIAVRSGHNIFADSEDNPFMRFLLLIITAAVIFLLSRFRVGAVLLFPFGTIALCVTEFMYESRHLVCLFLFLTASCMMVIFRNYMHNVVHSRTLKSAQISAVAFALVLSLLVAGIGSGVFYGIVRRFDPQKKELKIVTKYLSLEVLERIGVASMELIEDPDIVTNNQNDEQDTTRQDSENEDENLNNASSEADKDDGDQGSAEDHLDKKQKGPFDAIRYDWGIPLWVFWMVVGIVIIAAVIGTKLLLRRRRFRKMMKLDPAEQVRAMYLFFLKKFRQLKVRPVTGESPMDFARRNAERLHVFKADDAAATDFTALTEILVRTEYGGIRPSLDDTTRFETFYRRFYRNCREYLGRIQYIVKFFIL